MATEYDQRVLELAQKVKGGDKQAASTLWEGAGELPEWADFNEDGQANQGDVVWLVNKANQDTDLTQYLPPVDSTEADVPEDPHGPNFEGDLPGPPAQPVSKDNGRVQDTGSPYNGNPPGLLNKVDTTTLAFWGVVLVILLTVVMD